MALFTVNGTKIGLFKPLDWALTSGLRAFVAKIETEKVAAKRIFEEAKGEPIKIQVGPRIFEQLYITQLLPGDSRSTRCIEIRDRRWLWERQDCVRRYNIRTRTGETRLTGEGRPEQKKVENDEKYKEWSLNQGQPWTFLDAIKELFKTELGIELKLDENLGTTDRAIDFEDFSEKGSVADLAERLLSYARGYNIRLTDKGEVVLYDEHDGSEVAELVKEKKPFRGSGWATISDKRYLRPSKVKVLFTREIELRFDFIPGTFTAERGREPRRLLNVIPVPVKEMTLAQTSALPGQKVAQNTLITLRDYYATSELTTNLSPDAVGVLSDDQVAKLWMKGASPGSYLRIKYTQFGGNISREWMIYINALMTHWRRTFLVLRPWSDRLRSIKAERVAIQSFENAAGSRARSPVYCNFTISPNFYFTTKITKAAADPNFQLIARGYATRLEDAKPAPAPEINVKDPDIGLLRIFLNTDPMIEARYTVPGIPKKPLKAWDTANSQLGDAFLTFASQELEEDWGLATVLTCIQGAPNNSGQLHEVEIEPAKAEGALGYQLGPCEGPEMTVIVDETPTTTARFFWDDDHAAAIEECFYTGGQSPPDEVFENKSDVDALALGVAARVYEFFSDRAQGQFATDIASPGEMTGAIAAHVFSVDGQGVARKTVQIPPLVTPTNPLQYVEASVRRKLQRLVEL